MATYSVKTGVLTFSGSGSISRYTTFESIYNTISQYAPKYSTINSVTFKAYVRETSNKVGKADFYVFFGNDNGSSVYELYYGNGKIPKNNSSDLEVTLDLKEYVSSNTSNAGNLSYSGAERLYCRCQSSLLSRNYQLSYEIQYDYTCPTYTIKTVAGTGGKVTDTATYEVTIADQTKQITATPNAGYKFVKWTDSNGKTYTDDNTISVTISQNNISAHSTTVTYTAEFAPITYTVKFVNYDKTVLQSSSVNHGSTPSYTGATPTKPATAQYTYTFSGWSPPISTVTGDATYTAQFTATKRSYTISASGSNGSVSGGGTYQYGTSITLTANPNIGYEFTRWSDDNTDNPREITVTGNATYTAEFNKAQYSIIINPNGGIYNNSSTNTTILENYQSIINIDNPQKENNFFTHWSLSGTAPLKMIQTANGYTDYSGTNASTKFSCNLSQDGTYTNYRWYDLNATANAWNYLSFNTYNVSANETITITGYIRVNGTAAAQLNFYHGEKTNDYANNKFNVKNTNNDWKKFSFSRTFTTAVDTAVFQIYTSNLANLTGEINFDLKEIKIIRENGTILPTIIENGAGDLHLTAQYRSPIMKFKSVRIYYPTGEELVSPNNPLISNNEAQIIVQIALE